MEEGDDFSPYSSDVGTNLMTFPESFQEEGPAPRQIPDPWWYNLMKRHPRVCYLLNFIFTFLIIIGFFGCFYIVYKLESQHQQDEITIDQLKFHGKIEHVQEPHNEIKKQESVKYDKSANMDEVFKKRLEEFDAKMDALEADTNALAAEMYALGEEIYAFEAEMMNGTNKKKEPKEHQKLGEHDFFEKETAEELEVEEDEIKYMDEEDLEDEEYDEYNEEKEREAMGNLTRTGQEEKTGSDGNVTTENATEPRTSADQKTPEKA